MKLVPNQPLGLPRGSVRALIALLIVVTFCALAVMGEIEAAVVASVAQSIAAFYFITRQPSR